MRDWQAFLPHKLSTPRNLVLALFDLMQEKEPQIAAE